MRLVITVLLLVFCAACVIKALRWAFIPQSTLPRNRVRRQMIRLHLRLHPGRGHATAVELHRHWGRLASARKARYARPSLSRRERLLHATEHSIMLGRAQYGHAVRLPVEEHAVIFSPPRTGKTGWLSSVILHYPGPVLSTTTRADVYADTARVRSRLGRIDVFNPQDIGRVPSTMAWDPISGCLDIATAIRRADAFALAVSSQGVEDGAFWAAKTSDYLRAFFFAAAWARSKGAAYGMATTARWALNGASQEAEDILQDAGALDWSAQVQELRGPAEKTTQTVRMYLTRALSFLFDPSLARSVSPRADDDDSALNLESFVRQPNTLYLIASGQGETSPVASLFAALTNEIHYVAGLAGSWSPGGRLTRPLLFGLDEVTQICPVDLPTWLADSGGKGIQIIAVAHGSAQLRRRWGRDGAQVIMDTAGSQIVLPGIKDPDTLQALSTECGTVAMQERGQEHLTQHPVMTPAMIRSLPAKRALVIRGNRAPVVCKVRQVWSDRQYKRARHEPLSRTDMQAGPDKAPVIPIADAPELPPADPAGPPGPPEDGEEFPWRAA
jgi:type IV secretion system protein VirD4